MRQDMSFARPGGGGNKRKIRECQLVFFWRNGLHEDTTGVSFDVDGQLYGKLERKSVGFSGDLLQLRMLARSNSDGCLGTNLTLLRLS